jgi:hypothetical protein
VTLVVLFMPGGLAQALRVVARRLFAAGAKFEARS